MIMFTKMSDNVTGYYTPFMVVTTGFKGIDLNVVRLTGLDK